MPHHPLDEDVAALRGVGFLPLRHGVPAAEPGWRSCADLLERAELDAWTARVTGWLARTHRRPPHPSVAPTYLMQWYLDALVRVGATWVVHRGRLPSLAPSDLALRESPEGWPAAAAVLGDGFTCLPDDPAADHPGARTVPDGTALLADLDAQVRAHAAAFHDAFHPDVRVGSRQRWGMVDDALAACLWTARRDAGLPAGRLGTRLSCCFAFRVDPSLLCDRCPRQVVGAVRP